MIVDPARVPVPRQHQSRRCCPAYIAALIGLEELFLNRTGVTDLGITQLKGLTKLRELTLDGTRVSDAGLTDLEALTSLVILSLDNTKVTGAGVLKLQKAMPKTEVTQ